MWNPDCTFYCAWWNVANLKPKLPFSVPGASQAAGCLCSWGTRPEPSWSDHRWRWSSAALGPPVSDRTVFLLPPRSHPVCGPSCTSAPVWAMSAVKGQVSVTVFLQPPPPPSKKKKRKKATSKLVVWWTWITAISERLQLFLSFKHSLPPLPM